MYEKAFDLEIVTPDRVVFKGSATSLSAPGTQAGFQILYDHAPFLSSLEIGVLKVKDVEGNDTLYATSGGFVEVKKNSVVVLAETAERVDEIDVARATKASERASLRMQGRDRDTDMTRAQASLARALNRIKLAQRN